MFGLCIIPIIYRDMSHTAGELIGALRQACLERGCGSLKGLSLIFRKMDIDYSKRLCFQELKCGVKAYGLRMSEGYLRDLFCALDKDNNGTIDFAEFMQELHQPMTECRVRVVNEVFDYLDANSDGVLRTEDLEGMGKHFNDGEIKYSFYDYFDNFFRQNTFHIIK